MSTEIKNGEGDQKAADDGKKKEAAQSDESKAGGDIQKLREQLESARRSIEYHNFMNERYNSDPEFAAAYDELMNGKKKESESAKKLANEDGKGDDDNDLTPEEKRIKVLEDRLAKAENAIGETQETFEYKTVAEAREKINDKYEGSFRKMAEDAGYEPDSAAYRVLYSDVIQECRYLAPEFKLITKDGTPDPLLSYKPEFIKKAFENAMKRQEESGFVDANRRAVLKRKQEQNPVTDELSRYFKPEKLKTPEGRAAALRDSFRHRFGNQFKIN